MFASDGLVPGVGLSGLLRELLAGALGEALGRGEGEPETSGLARVRRVPAATPMAMTTVRATYWRTESNGRRARGRGRWPNRSTSSMTA
jgi:hypothetical protein